MHSLSTRAKKIIKNAVLNLHSLRHSLTFIKDPELNAFTQHSGQKNSLRLEF